MKSKKIRNMHTKEEAELIDIINESYGIIYIIETKDGKQERWNAESFINWENID